MPSLIKLIVGLGNPGPEYLDTRHNAGFWFTDSLVDSQSAFSSDKKFHGETARLIMNKEDCRILKPVTFMNHSGRAVKSIMDYYDIEPAEMLVAHDEIDLDAGTIRLKDGGGHGGHNGVRDIIEQTGLQEFLRLRIGVGHPGHKDEVIDYVLTKPNADDKILILEGINRAIDIIPLLFNGQLNKAMTLLNSGKLQDQTLNDNGIE